MQQHMENASKKSFFFGTSFLEVFWTSFERFWEAKNIDFRAFFDVFSKLNLKWKFDSVLKAKKTAREGGEGIWPANSSPARGHGEG